MSQKDSSVSMEPRKPFPSWSSHQWGRVSESLHFQRNHSFIPPLVPPQSSSLFTGKSQRRRQQHSAHPCWSLLLWRRCPSSAWCHTCCWPASVSQSPSGEATDRLEEHLDRNTFFPSPSFVNFSFKAQSDHLAVTSWQPPVFCLCRVYKAVIQAVQKSDHGHPFR